MHPNDSDGLANSVEQDQTAPFRSSLILVCTVFSDPPVSILVVFTVIISYKMIENKVFLFNQGFQFYKKAFNP